MTIDTKLGKLVDELASIKNYVLRNVQQIEQQNSHQLKTFVSFQSKQFYTS